MRTARPRWLDALGDVFSSDRKLDAHLVGSRYVDLGPQADRARGIAARLNAYRSGPPKDAVVLWTNGFAAVTRTGPFIYVAHVFAQHLSDDGLAFVLAHEMAHHDLGHLSTMYVAAGMLGNQQRMELAADRQGLDLVTRAGFARSGAIEVFDPRWEEDPPADPFAGWPPALSAYLNRFRTSHPPMAERRRALQDPG